MGNGRQALEQLRAALDDVVKYAMRDAVPEAQARLRELLTGGHATLRFNIQTQPLMVQCNVVGQDENGEAVHELFSVDTRSFDS